MFGMGLFGAAVLAPNIRVRVRFWVRVKVRARVRARARVRVRVWYQWFPQNGKHLAPKSTITANVVVYCFRAYVLVA